MKIAVLFLVMLFATQLADAREIKITFAGSTVDSEEADVDGIPDSGYLSLGEGKSNFGPVHVRAKGDTAPWDGFSVCSVSDGDDINGVIVDILEDTSVIHFKKNDDMLFLQLDESLPTQLCFSFVDNKSASFEFNYQIIGGFGKFKEATGDLQCVGDSFRVTPGNNAFVSRCSGDVNLTQRRN